MSREEAKSYAEQWSQKRWIAPLPPITRVEDLSVKDNEPVIRLAAVPPTHTFETEDYPPPTAPRLRDKEKQAVAEMVDHPVHYGGADNPYEAIKVIEAWGLDFCLGNTVKYLSRAGKKDGNSELQDLKKALWYLQRRIAQVEGA